MEDKSTLLPPELWIKILTDLRDLEDYAKPGAMRLPSSLVPCLSVSRRFHDITVPLVYEAIPINVESTGYNNLSKSILAALKANPEKAAFVKHLYLYGDKCECRPEVTIENAESIDTSHLEGMLPMFIALKHVTVWCAELSNRLLTRLLRAPSVKSPTVKTIVFKGSCVSGKSQLILPQPLSNLTQLHLEVVYCKHSNQPIISLTPTEGPFTFEDRCLISFIQLVPKLEVLVVDSNYLRHVVRATEVHASCLKYLRSLRVISDPGISILQVDFTSLFKRTSFLEDLDLDCAVEMAASQPYFGFNPPSSPPRANIELPNLKYFRGLPFMASYILRGKPIDTLHLIVQPNIFMRSAPTHTGVARARRLELSCRTWYQGLLQSLVAGLTGVEDVDIEVCECDEGPRIYDPICHLYLFPDVRRFRMRTCHTGNKKWAPPSIIRQFLNLGQASRIRPGLVQFEIPRGRSWQRRNAQSKWYPQELRYRSYCG